MDITIATAFALAVTAAPGCPECHDFPSMILRLTADCRIIRRLVTDRSIVEQIRFAQFFFHYARGMQESKPGNSGFSWLQREGVLTESRFSCVAAHPEAYILYFDSGKKRGLTVAGQGVFSQDKPVDQKNLEIKQRSAAVDRPS